MADDEITITNPTARASEKAETRTIDAPPHRQHIENFAKLIDLAAPARYIPVSATVVRDNAVLLDQAVAPPEVVGTIESGQTVRLARLSHSFTSRDYTAAVEAAPPLHVNPSPFEELPTVVANAAGAVTVRLRASAAALAAWPGYVAIMLSSEPYALDGLPAWNVDPGWAPINGHQVATATQGIVWVAPLPSAAAHKTTFAAYEDRATGWTPLAPGTRYHATAYLTSHTIPAVPSGPGEAMAVTSYPSAPFSWVQA